MSDLTIRLTKTAVLSCRMPRLVVFDLDGTLIDSHRDIANAANALVVELGGRALPEPAIVAMVGEGAAVLVRRALAAAEINPATPGALDRFLALYDARLLEHTRPYPGTVEALEALGAHAALCVLTNKPQQPTERILDGLQLRRCFRDVIGGDTPFGRKPDPAGLLHLVAAAGATADQTVMVGDSPVDLAAARNAGTRVCLVRYGFGYRFAAGDFRGDELFADSPDELVGAMRQLE
jgi:phosphoglycolate phosphatase